MESKGTVAGQVFSGELLLSLMVFLAALIVTLDLWGSNIRDVFAQETLKSMEEQGSDAAEELIRTPGVPSDWGPSNVTSLGLVNESRELMPDKVANFIGYLNATMADNKCGGGASNYECNLHMLGIAGYGFFFNLTYLNGTTAEVDGMQCVTGVKAGGMNQTITIVRTALLGEDIMRAYITVWK